MRLDQHFIKTTLNKVEFTGRTSDNIRLALTLSHVQPGDYFVLFEKDDLDHVVKEALQCEAAGFVVTQKDKEGVYKLVPTIPLIVVENITEALKKLATAWRSNFSYPVIGITGSVGKSSTKKVLSNILHEEGIPHHVTFGNDNSIESLAVDLLHMNSSHQVALFEMGIAKRGEMAELADMVRPSYAIITNVGHSNMEGLGSIMDIAMEKRDIFKNFSQGSIGVVNGDVSIIGNVGYVHPVIKFGSKTINQVQARKVHVTDSRISFTLKLYDKKYPVFMEHTHEGSIFNALAAAAAAHLLEIPNEVIVKGIQAPLIIPGRFERRSLTVGKGTLINDCSHANPESVKIALLAFQQLSTKGQKIAVIGDMEGLGVNSPFWHRQIGRFLRKVSSVKHLILVGDMVKWTRKTLPVRLTSDLVPNWEAAAEKLKEKLHEESVVLVKGSDNNLHNLVELFSEQTT